MPKKMVLVPGAAGFIGYYTVRELLRRGYLVTGVDDLNDYYDVRLKRYRLKLLSKAPGFTFFRGDIRDKQRLAKLFKSVRPVAVINLAARAGVRKSLDDPGLYCMTNVIGALNLLECCREQHVGKFVLASTSSLYAGGTLPFREDQPVNTPISPYAATKKAAEAMAYTYHHLYGMDVVVLRYFTVYGPMGRPDMSYFRFIQAMQEGRKIEIFGDGAQSRDFTYVEDIARGTVDALKPSGYHVINLGSDKPYSLKVMIGMIAQVLGQQVRQERREFPKVDMRDTWADITSARRVLGWKPTTSLKNGIEATVSWHVRERAWLRKLKAV